MTAAYQLRGLRYDYGSQRVLQGLDVSFEQGKTTALVGPNGAGKTTLLKLLAFLETPDGGEILFQGKPFAKEQQLGLRRKVGLVQQNPYLLQGSVLSNVEIGLRLRGHDKAARLERALDVIAELGLAHKARQSVRELSGGEAQKVAIARILVLEPEVLLLDEPFTYLDASVAVEIEALIAAIRENGSQTIIFSTHDQLRAQTLADSVHSLLRGRVVPTSLVNLYTGRLDVTSGLFDTGKIQIHVPDGAAPGEHIAIAPVHIVLSPAPLRSTMRNVFEGRVTTLSDRDGRVHVTIDAGEAFHAVITHAALDELRLALGTVVWVSFKSSAVAVF